MGSRRVRRLSIIVVSALLILAFVLSWKIGVIVLVFTALVVVALALVRARGTTVSSATALLKTVTRPLGAVPHRAPGKLIVQRGTNVGQEYPLSEQITRVGRDGQFADFAVQDEYVSNPHFTIQREGTQFYIVDEDSTNGTQLNGMVLQPHQRVPLAPDAIIELGQTQLQFKQRGLATQSMDTVPVPRRESPSPAASSNPYPTEEQCESTRDS